jgi:hypothetical protein
MVPTDPCDGVVQAMKGWAIFGFLAATIPCATQAQLCPLSLVAQDESGHRNIPNYRYDATHTAAGHWQITDTNWRHYAPQVDVDIAKWPNALSAPEQLQGQVAGIMRAKLGCLPWVPYNARLRRDLSTPGAAVARTSQHIKYPWLIRSWTKATFARYSAPSSIYDPMHIALR